MAHTVPPAASTTDAEPVDGLARDVLVYWALPLLARARRCADSTADGTAPPVSRESWEMLADDIAALIGHGVTDQVRADELDELLADEPPIRPMVIGAHRLGTAGYFYARTGRGPIPAVPADELPPHAMSMPHDVRRIMESSDPEETVAGCPPGCPRRLAAERRCPSCWEELAGPPRLGCTDPDEHTERAKPVTLTAAPGSGRPEGPVVPKWRAPAAPVEETPTERAYRLDRAAHEAGRVYRAALHAADEAHRALGGRP